MQRLALLFFATTMLLAQQPEKSDIMASGHYFYGEGIAFDSEEARDQALAELTAQIAVKVSSSFEEKIIEDSQGLQENTQNILRTYSSATLKNVNIVKQSCADGRIRVFCYLRKTEVDRIFEERKKLVHELCNEAEKYAGQLNAAYALKLYYFAAILLNSLPDQNIAYEDVNYTTRIPARINDLVLRTAFEFVGERRVSDNERDVTLAVRLKDEAVALLDFTFWDGANQVSVQARDGLATVRLLGASVNFTSLKINVKYAYYEARDEYGPIADLWPLVEKPVFTTGREVELRKKKVLAELFKKPEAVSSEFNLRLEFEASDAPREEIVNSTLTFLNVLDSGNPAGLYGDDPFLENKLTSYLQYNRPDPIDRNIDAIVNRTDNGWELRRIRMLHEYPRIHRQTTEYLVLDFDSSGTLRDLNVAVNEFLYRKFAREGEYGNDWGNRLEIVKFLEKYRSAYLTRDIETVGKMFAEDAVIIVGRQLQTQKLPPGMLEYQQLANEPTVEYQRFTKEKYLKRQRRIFRLDQDILLDFASVNIIRKNNAPDIYGVEMRQNYSSSTYSDEGYLFLLIDFADVDPLIYVRAWQPHTWSQDELIRTANYKIYR